MENEGTIEAPMVQGGELRTVALPTGEIVTVRRRGGQLSIEDVRGGSVSVVETSDGSYVLPDRVNLTRYDRSLFAVESLLAQSENGSDVPVLLEVSDSPDSVDTSALQNVRHLESADVIAAEVDPVSAPEALSDLLEDGSIERVSIDRQFDRRASLEHTTQTQRHVHGLTGDGVTVAVLDTGIDATHPDLADRVVDRVDLVDGGDGGSDDAGTDRPLDPNGHGTIVAGILAGTGTASNDSVNAGVAPGTDLVDVRVMNERGVARASTIVAGIEYAVDADVDVVLLSVGSPIDGSEEIAESVAWATEHGVIVVAAAGNLGQPRSIGAPGQPENVITVGATDRHGAVASYSSMGPTLDGYLKPELVAGSQGVVGPRANGTDRFAIDTAGNYTRAGGTSMAAPQVAGAVALMLENEPTLSAREIENRLTSAARPIDGAGAYAHGSGELAVERTLEPDVVAHDAVTDFGLIEDDERRNRTITLVNHDDRSHDLSFETVVRNVDLGTEATGTARLNRTSVSLSPGEQTTLKLTIDGNTTSGAHSGTIRYSVAGDPRTIAFGFVRGGTVTVEKRPLTAGDRVDGDELWVLTEEGTHDELLEFENGTASFVAGGGTYVLWSTGYDEGSGTTVFLSERRTVDGSTHVVLDEGDTVPVGVDVGPIVDRYGPLTNLSVDVSISTEYAGGLARRSVSRANVDGRAVRVSEDPQLDVATTFLLTTDDARQSKLDVSDVFHLAHGVDGVHGPSVVTVTPDVLETTEHRYHRTTVDETYSAQDRATFDAVWTQRSSRWFDLGGRTTQHVHRLRGVANYRRTLEGDGWQAHPGSPRGSEGSVGVLSHPMLGLLETTYGDDGSLAVSGTPFSDGAGTTFDPTGVHTMSASMDGVITREMGLSGGSGSLDDLAVTPGENVTLRLAGNNSGGYLSTKTLTEVILPGYAPPATRDIVVEDRPPTVTGFGFRDADEVNAVEPGSVTFEVDVDLVGAPVDPVVWYSLSSPTDPPWENESTWIRAETKRTGDRLLAAMDVVEEAETVSVAVKLRDIFGRQTRTMTTDAVHVGAAPNTSTSTIVGRIVAADGTPAANDTLVFRPVGGGSSRYVSTDLQGRFEVEVPRTETYDLAYVRGEPWTTRTPVEDDRPAWLPLVRVDAAEDVDLGDYTLPPGHELSVNVTDERGVPVPGATVRVIQQAGNVSVSESLLTTERGLARASASEVPGIDLAGPVQLVVTPPDEDLYPDQTHRLTVDVDEPRTVNVTLETGTPDAVLAAFGTFEPGDVVFIHARKSDVPAGVAEYRWDLDGDGQADRVTEKPIVRYVPEEDTLQPTVTVVDEAGKSDESTLTLPIVTE